MRPQGTPEQLELRRRQAVDFIVNKGLRQAEVCRLLNVRYGTVSVWMKAYRCGGEKALAARKHPGPKPKLNARQRQGLVKRLLAGPQVNGYPTDIWTCPPHRSNWSRM